MGYIAHIPLIEGRFREAILKAEWDVASTAAGNRGHEKPGTAASHSGWWRGAFAPDPATGTEAGPGPTTPRRSAVRRASQLRGRCYCLASVASRVTARHVQGWTSLGAPPTPLARGSAATKERRGRRRTRM